MTGSGEDASRDAAGIPGFRAGGPGISSQENARPSGGTFR
jgi:hypothetical protein